MAKPIIDGALGERIAPFLPPRPRRARFPGRRPLASRKVLSGILLVLKTAMAWEDLPQQLGCGSGMRCWHRLREWQDLGLWPPLQPLWRAKLPDGQKIDWSRADVDRDSQRAVMGSNR